MQYYFQFPVRGISHSRPLPSGVPARTSSLKFWREGTDSNRRLSFVQCRVATARHVSRERSNRLSYPLVVFRLPFVKERRYYRIHHWESQWQKIHPAVCGRQGAPLWRNEPAKNKVGTSPRRSQRNQLEFAVALASEIFSGVITTSHFCVDALVSHVPASICSYFITILLPFEA